MYPRVKIDLPHASRLARSTGDRHAEFTHQMPADTAEASARFLIRTVPLIYGGLVGALADRVLLGLGAGLLLSVLLDLRMRKGSLLRPWLQPLVCRCCPSVARAASWLFTRLARWGLPVPAGLVSISCDQA